MARSVVGDDDDAMSSPDPLNEPLDVTWTVPLSSRGSKTTTTRSQTSRRFLALGDTPRKRTFALDVGNEKSPQKILVTVEAGSDGRDRSGVSRRLFQLSPSAASTVRRPKGRRTTTTTKVPLKGLSDDDIADATTPKPRGRPRRSGTPAATTVKGRKRTGTPVRKAPRARSRASTVESLASDAGVEGPEEEEATPRPGSRVPRLTKRKATSSPRNLVSSEETQPKKRGRPRQTEVAPQDIFGDSSTVAENKDSEGLTHERSEDDDGLEGAGHEKDEEDVWMANLSEEARQNVRSEDDLVEEARATDDAGPRGTRGEQDDDDDDVSEDYNDLGDRDHYSDGGSEAGSEAASHTDTVAAGEEFTMISIGSLPSMQPNSSMTGPRQEEDNDEATSPRQSGNNRDQQEKRSDTGQGLGLSMFPTSALRTWHRSPRRTLVQKQTLGQQLARKQLPSRDSSAPNESFKASLLYEDSFSDIPEAVLAAATPGRTARQEVVVEDMQPSIEPRSTVTHPQPPSEPSSRMLTPPDDETPSPSPTSPVGNEPSSSPSVPDQDRRRARTGSNETPLDKTSPRDERPPAKAVPSAEPVCRPSLSPIVRAGRALQLITSDSPSPRERESVLRSPFRAKSQSPAATASSAAVLPAQDPPTSAQAQPQERSWADALAPFSHIKKLVMNGAQAFSSPSPSRGAWLGKSGAAPESNATVLSEDRGRSATGSSPPRNARDIEMDDEDEECAMGVEPQGDGFEGEEGKEEEEEDDDDDDEEDDIWAVEAQRPTPSPEKLPVGNSRQPVYNHGRLQHGREPSSASQLSVDENVTQTTKKLDLSSFFSSPADLPAMRAPSSFGLFRALDARTDENKRPTAIDKKRPAMSEPEEKSVPRNQTSFQVRDTARRVDLFSSVRHDFPERPTGILADTTNQQPSLSRPSFVHMPQKHNFNPRPRGADPTALRQSIFSIPGPALPPHRGPVDDEDDEDHDEARRENESDQDDEYEEESSLFMHQVGPLRPLPDRAVSPTKSCLRSPLKPKTPGRVVDFDEDVMSPLAQARARAERKRLSMSTNGNNKSPEHVTESHGSSRAAPPDGATSAGPARRGLFAAFSEHVQKENTTAAPITTNTRTATAVWTRVHWIRLDQLLQERRRIGALPFQLAHGGVAARRAAACHALLGKHVSTASGETMELQPFHLDVVAAFAAEEPCVGGVAWDEAVLARRLFSLVLGEQRRRDGKVPLRR